MFEIFKPPGKAIGAEGKRYLADNEYTAAHLYVLMIYPFLNLFLLAMKFWVTGRS